MLLLSAAEVLLTWAVMAFALMGIGSMVLALFGKDFSLQDSFWMGLAISVAVLETWNLVLPVTAWTTVFLLAAGILGLALNGYKLGNGLRGAWQDSKWLFLLGLAFAALLALRACGPCDYYDTGLYGAHAVRWIETYPTVPGLANLHGRFGLNSSAFLCIAAVGQGIWKDLGFHLFTGFMLSAFWATLLPGCRRIIRAATASPADWFHGILAVPAFFWTTRSRIVGTQSDEPATVVCLVAAGMLLASLSEDDHKDDAAPEASRLILAATLFSLAVVFKESTAVFALLAWCLAFRRIWQTMPSPEKRLIHLGASVLFSSVILLPWLARSIILSGYPFFPATVFAFPVSWKTPFFAARWYALDVQSWGRIPDGSFRETRGLLWLGDWIHHAVRNRAAVQMPVAISLAGLGIALILRWRGGKRRSTNSWLWLLLPGLAGIVFWFAASPDLRFGQFSIWATAATLGVWGIESLELEKRVWHTEITYKRIVLVTLVLSLAWCMISFGWIQPIEALRGVRQPPPLPKVDVVIRHTASGLAVYMPAQGNQCWDGPLPCTPYFDESLRLRDPESPGKGFASEGRAEILQTYW